MARKKNVKKKLHDVEYASTAIVTCPESILELIGEHSNIIMSNNLMVLATIDSVLNLMDDVSTPVLKKYIDSLIFQLDHAEYRTDIVMFVAIPQELKEQLVEKGLM